MEREEFLAQHTFSEAGLNPAQRVYATLTHDSKQTAHRTAKLLALLIERLEQKELLDMSEIDELLIEIV